MGYCGNRLQRHFDNPIQCHSNRYRLKYRPAPVGRVAAALLQLLRLAQRLARRRRVLLVLPGVLAAGGRGRRCVPLNLADRKKAFQI